MNEADLSAICARQPSALEARYENKKATRSWTIGRRKAFAVWHFGKEQPGPHVRSNDEAVRTDARVKPSTIAAKYMEKTNNFVWLDMSATWTDEELERLVAACAVLATRKDGGMKRGGELGDVYIVVRKALQAAPAAMHPPPPHHAGGPAAKFFGTEHAFAADLGRWLEKLAGSIATTQPEETKRIERALKAAKRAQHGWMSSSGDCSRSAGEIVGLYAARGEAERVRALIADLDDRVMLGELKGAMQQHAPHAVSAQPDDFACERVLWRCADATGNPGRWIARLTSGKYALLVKLGKRWQWVEGSRDDVLSSVPDSDFQAATEIVLLRDEPSGR